MLEEFAKVLEIINTRIVRYDPSKVRCVNLSTGGTISIEKLAERIISAGPKIIECKNVFQACYDHPKLADIVQLYAKHHKIMVEPKKEIELNIPENYKKLTLNMDQTHPGREPKFFMTTEKEIISEVAGAAYLNVYRMALEDAIPLARIVTPKYNARIGPGITQQVGMDGEVMNVFNTYIPPRWMEYTKPLPDRLPQLFEKLVNHLFPLKIEREYFYSWLHDSLFKRSLVYLVLCGAPGAGKNRLKVVLRALHGHSNTVDGKKSTLTERFNSQLGESTLTWFDELHYNMDMENVMKEIQNDTISIEKKGIDATRSTRIYSSLIISNNKPRDNYIAFDARKFSPLVINPNRLDTSMSESEITELTNKVEDWASDTFDLAFIAQIGRWIRKHGRSKKWPTLEYKGPMFYKLAHTSMSRWQKKAAMLVLETPQSTSGRVHFHPEKGFLWSTMEESVSKKQGYKTMQFPDYSTIRHFFDIFMDDKGRKSFETEDVVGNLMGDFWVRPLHKKTKILTEVDVIKDLGGKDGKEENIPEEEYYDL